MKKVFARKVLACFLLLVLAFSLAACNAADAKPEVLTQPIVDEAMIPQLLAYRNTLLGDSILIKEILTEKLPAKEFMASFDITLNRLSLTYGLQKNTTLTTADVMNFWQEQTAKEVIFYNSAALFSLVENLESIEFNIEGYALPTYTVTKADLETLMGVELQSIATVEDWQEIIIKDNLENGSKLKSFFKSHPLEKNT